MYIIVTYVTAIGNVMLTPSNSVAIAVSSLEIYKPSQFSYGDKNSLSRLAGKVPFTTY